MKVLILSSLKRKVFSRNNTSRERLIFELATGLIQKGHEVTLLGTKDTVVPGARIIPVSETSISNLPPAENPEFRNLGVFIQALEKLVKIQGDYDIIHSHFYPDFFPPLIEKELKIPLLVTLHIQADPYLDKTLLYFKKTNFIAISRSQKKLLPNTNVLKLIYNGIDTQQFSFQNKKQNYLLWIGRITAVKKENGEYIDPKGVSWAIKLSQETNIPLLLGGSIRDMKAFQDTVLPHLNQKIRWIGQQAFDRSLPREKVIELMRNAKAFLMTINWEEPFGLVMAEAMSCGTPVIGFDRGAVAEVVENGKTGFVVDQKKGISGLKEALKHIDEIKPEACRERVEKYFSIEKMINEYEKTYKEIKK